MDSIPESHRDAGRATSRAWGLGGHLEPGQRPPGGSRVPGSGAAEGGSWAAPLRLRQELRGNALKPLQTFPCLLGSQQALGPCERSKNKT